MKILLNLVAILFLMCLVSVAVAQDTLVYYNFNNYNGSVDSIPAGWTIPDNSISTSTGTYYTSTASSGLSGPNSYKFRSNGVIIIPPSFNNADSVRFWIKGNSTSSGSIFYLFESADSVSWDTVVSISPLPTTNYPSNDIKSYPVQFTSKWLKFYYKKDTGNVAFDDFLLTGPEPVTASFSASDVCFGDSSCFQDMSSSTMGAITSRVWDFGDGNSSTQQNPCHLYSSAGSYTVQLMVINSNSDTDVVSKTMNVGVLPGAGFLPADSAGCNPLTINYLDTSTISTGTITGYEWNFGNGLTSTDVNPIAGFQNPGTFNVTLIVTSDFGCQDTVTGTVTVYPAPLVDTSATTITNPSCGASDGSVTGITVSGVSPIACLWMPGMDTTLDKTNAAEGTYIFSATDANNCSSTVSFTLVSSGAPPAPAAPSPAPYCDGDLIDSLTASGTGGTLNWYDDSLLTTLVGTGNSLMPPLSLGNNYFYVTETTTCEGQATVVLVTVLQAPSANFSSTSTMGCEPVAINFINTSSAQGTLDSCFWDFGDGLQGFYNCNNSIPYTYSIPGVYTVSLTVTDVNGCSDVETKTGFIQVNPNPLASFVIQGIVSPFSFIDSSFDAESWFWDFGDGFTDTIQNPSHSFGNGIWNICLTVTNNWGCSDDTCITFNYVGDDEITSGFNIFISPNPSTGKFNLFFENKFFENDNFNLEIRNILGELVYNNQGLNIPKQFAIDLSGQPEGIYFVTIQSGEHIAVRKVEVVR